MRGKAKLTSFLNQKNENFFRFAKEKAELKTLLSLKSSGHSRGNGPKIIIFPKDFRSMKEERRKDRNMYFRMRFAKPRDFVPVSPKITVFVVSGVITISVLYVNCGLGNGVGILKSMILKSEHMQSSP